MASAVSSIGPLVETDWLAANLDRLDVKLLDASWHMPAEDRNAEAEFVASHIRGTRFFSIDEISDRQSPYPHMLPTAEAFAKAVEALGISNADTVIVYDSKGLFSAARAWWMFRVFGHENVAVLNGGLPKWKAEGKAVESGIPVMAGAATFTPHFKPELLADAATVSTTSAQILDARSASRFSGEEPEPRAGLRSGHIPGSHNLPWGDLLNPPHNTFRTAPELEAAFHAAGINLNEPVIATCGSGISACTLALGMALLGKQDVAVYDGSWAEWGSKPEAYFASARKGSF